MRLKRQVYSIVRQFLDTEAEVNEDDEEDDDGRESVCNDLEDPFIDDDLEINEANTRSPRDFPPDEAEKALNDLFTRILSNSVRPSHDGHPEQEFSSTTGKIVRLHFQGQDYPLWKVDCRVGAEDLAVLSLMSTVEDCHQVRSAFTRGSIRGSIYIEGTMNGELLELLKVTPGVVHGRLGVRRRTVNQSEYSDLLTMKNNTIEVDVGDWVVVQTGLYKGDIALVNKTGSWGAQVLLVPRIGSSHRNNSKRKKITLKPPAELFDPSHFQESRVVHKGEEDYSLGMLDFEKGLLVKNFGYHSFEKGAEDIPYELSAMFKQSNHPDVVLFRMPRPREWCMKENDQVIIISSGGSGILKSVHALYAEVERTNSGQSGGLPVLRWNEHVPWHDIRKFIDVGDYVRVNGGMHVGKSGWVVSLCSEVATFAIQKLEGSINNQDSIELIDVLINFLEILDPPFTFLANENLKTTQTIPFKKLIRHPWCGANILISKQNHPRKGETGEIREVVGRQDGSLIRLNVQLTRYNPSAPFQNINVDENDVVELSTLKPLSQYLNPGDAFLRPFGQDTSNPHPHPSLSTGTQSSDNCTPLPTSLHSSGTPDPAWNPGFSSAAPSTSPAPGPSTCDTSSLMNSMPRDGNRIPEVTPAHVLLNEKLIGAKLNVIVNGGEFVKKELVAVVSPVEGRLTLRYTRYHTSILLDPGWVTPKYPNPTHDNGLLIVIKGEHCGKYVRRIHHRRVGGLVSIILAVMIRSENLQDVVTGERLELNIESLCTITESKKEKDLNWAIMQTVRKEYRSRHVSL